MTDYPTPGAYFQDVFPVPVPSFLTGIPAFLGQAAEGPYTPQRLTLWPQFEPIFGGSSAGFLSAAVRGFFENDGLLCYVVRLDETRTGMDRLAHGLAALDDLDDVDLICAPDVMADVRVGAMGSADSHFRTVTGSQEVLLGHCRDRGDRFAILDSLPAVDSTVVTKQRNALAGEAGGYGALYYPWLWAPGPGGQPRYVPPCGHLAGIYSRNDRRIGVHKAPANEVVEGVLDLYVNLTGSQVGELYGTQLGVPYHGAANCLRALPGRGIRVWGARTLSADPA